MIAVGDWQLGIEHNPVNGRKTPYHLCAVRDQKRIQLLIEPTLSGDLYLTLAQKVLAKMVADYKGNGILPLGCCASEFAAGYGSIDGSA